MTAYSPAAPPSGSRPPRGGTRGRRLPMTPGRAVALVIGVPVVLAIIAYNSYDLVLNVGRGSFPVRENVRVAASGLTVSLGGGGATVHGGAATPGVARVSGTVTYHLGRPSVQLNSGNIGLNCPWFDEGNCSLNATVAIPSNTALTMSTGGGDLTASHLTGSTKLSTGGGNITLTHANGSLSLSSAGGDVTFSDVQGETATVSADGGNINGTGIGIPDVSVTSNGGDVDLTFAASAAVRNLHVETNGGNVTVIVPPGHYDVADTSNGGSATSSIKSDLSSPNHITITTNGGDISLSES